MPYDPSWSSVLHMAHRLTQDAEPTRLITIGEAARILGFSTRAVQEACARGDIPFMRLGDRGHRRFDRDVIEHLAAKARTEQVAS